MPEGAPECEVAESGVVPGHQPEVAGLRTVLDVVRKEIASLQLQTEKLSSNILSARKELTALTSQIHESKSFSESTPPRVSSGRLRRTEGVFSTCSTARSSLGDSPLSSPYKSARRKLFGKASFVEAKAEQHVKQGWLWKTPITPSAKPLQSGWSKRWFVLKESTLCYYQLKETSVSPEDEAASREPRRAFQIQPQGVLIRKVNMEDLAKKTEDLKRILVKCGAESLDSFLYMQFPEGRMVLRARDAEEADAWFFVISRRQAQAVYVDKTRCSKVEPDKRVLRILEEPDIDDWDFKNCANTESLLIGLTALLQNHVNVRFLSLARCKLSDEGILKIQVPLASIFPKVSLQHLNLSENMLRPKGATALGLAICECSTLRELFLDDNQLGDRGLEILAKNIWGSCRPIGVVLGTFSVVNNNITDRGIQAFGDILARAAPPIGLMTLRLAQNRISDQGAAIMRVSKAHPNIIIDMQCVVKRYSRRSLFQNQIENR